MKSVITLKQEIGKEMIKESSIGNRWINYNVRIKTMPFWPAQNSHVIWGVVGLIVLLCSLCFMELFSILFPIATVICSMSIINFERKYYSKMIVKLNNDLLTMNRKLIRGK